MEPLKKDNVTEKQATETEQTIDGLLVIKELLDFKGRGVIHNNTIPLQLLEDTALQLYNLKENPANKLYVYIQLAKYYRKRGMLQGRVVMLPPVIYDFINKH